jgi:hypothetical protein
VIVLDWTRLPSSGRLSVEEADAYAEFQQPGRCITLTWVALAVLLPKCGRFARPHNRIAPRTRRNSSTGEKG